MSRIWTRAAALAIVMAGCSGLGLTPEQARVLDQLAVCGGEGPGARLVEVQTNGRFTLEGRHSQIEFVKRCLAERFGYARWGDPRIQEQIIEPSGP